MSCDNNCGGHCPDTAGDINPSHYKLLGGSVETYDLIRDRMFSYAHSEAYKAIDKASALCVAAWYKDVIKYMMRWPNKGGKKDLLKAREYLDRMIEEYDDEL